MSAFLDSIDVLGADAFDEEIVGDMGTGSAPPLPSPLAPPAKVPFNLSLSPGALKAPSMFEPPSEAATYASNYLASQQQQAAQPKAPPKGPPSGFLEFWKKPVWTGAPVKRWHAAAGAVGGIGIGVVLSVLK